jgi:ribosomal protein L21E
MPHTPKTASRKETDLQSSPDELRVGGWAEVVSGHKRYLGRVGKILSMDSAFVELKFKRNLGHFSFRRDQIVAVPSDQPTADNRPRRDSLPGRKFDPRHDQTALRVGGWAKVVRADKRYVGRVGKVVSMDSGLVDLKFKRTIGSFSFKRDQLEAIEGDD